MSCYATKKQIESALRLDFPIIDRVEVSSFNPCQITIRVLVGGNPRAYVSQALKRNLVSWGREHCPVHIERVFLIYGTQLRGGDCERAY